MAGGLEWGPGGICLLGSGACLWPDPQVGQTLSQGRKLDTAGPAQGDKCQEVR